MNRKWLVALTCCILISSLALVRAQSPQSPPQAPSEQAPPALVLSPAPLFEVENIEVEHFEWVAGEMVDLPFEIPLDVDAASFTEGVMLEPLDPLLLFGPDAAMAFAEPVATASITAFSSEQAQGVAVSAGEPVFFEQPVPFVGPDPADTITFVGFEAGLGGQTLSGAPYSAQVTSEFVQTLADGNKIERKNSTTVYRDGQGRTRREQALPAIGQYSAASETPQAIFINDPVTGVSYVLDPARKTARKMIRPNVRTLRPAPRPNASENPRPPQAQENNQKLQGAMARRQANVSTETLGSRNIEGLFAEGTRVTRTIPAGTVGNQQPIQITSERWFSPELRLNLLVINKDPMRGTSTTTLTSVRRDEPSPALFQVPSDYTVQEAGPRGMRMSPRAPQR